MFAEDGENIEPGQEMSAGSDTGRLFWCTQILVLMQDMELPVLYPAKRTFLCAGGTERRFYPDGGKSRIAGFHNTVQSSEPGLWFYWVCDCETI